MSKALLIIDIQVGMFSKADPVHDGDILLDRIGVLITKARSSGTPVIYIQHNAGSGKPLEPGSSGWEIHPNILPIDGDIIIQKFTPDSFHETDLQYELSIRGIKKVVIAGIQTELCVDTTCRRASSLGYIVTVVSDAHSTWNRGNLSAKQIIEHHNSILHWFANVEETDHIQF